MKTLILMALMSLQANAATLVIDQTITSSLGLIGTNQWEDNVTFRTTVRFVDNTYVYQYYLRTSQKDVSHMIISTCPEATVDAQGGVMGNWSANSPSNPNIPVAMYGAKWDAIDDTTQFLVTATSPNAPEMGWMYAKGGAGVTIWTDGAIVPVPSCQVPEPSSMALLGLGGLTLLRRRR